jgi:hypothetical protein
LEFKEIFVEHMDREAAAKRKNLGRTRMCPWRTKTAGFVALGGWASAFGQTTSLLRQCLTRRVQRTLNVD